MLHQHLLTAKLQPEVQARPVCSELIGEAQREQQGPPRQRSKGKQQVKGTAERTRDHLGLGQLAQLIRGKYAVDAISITQLKGKPFRVADLMQQLSEHLA